MKNLGKFLQLVGLIVLPLSIVLQLSDLLGRPIGVSQMLLMLGFGATAFYLGRFLEGYARS